MWWKYWCSGQMARGYFDHNQLLVCGILNSICCWCDGLWCVLSELVFVAGLVCVGCLNQKELWMWWSVPCIACVRCLNQNELWMWWSVLCIAGTGVCGRLGARGVFQSERAVDEMVCAVHCRNWRLWQAWCVWGVSIRMSCWMCCTCCSQAKQKRTSRKFCSVSWMELKRMPTKTCELPEHSVITQSPARSQVT